MEAGMAHDDQFTAVGPPLAGSGKPRSAFSSKAAGMVYGANVQGVRAGVYGESVRAETDRDADVPGTGVHGVGDNFGVFGKINPSAPGVADRGVEVAGVYGQHHRGRSGVVGAAMPPGPDSPDTGTGVAGLSVSSLGNPTRFQALPDPADGAGTGVYGSSGSGAGVLGTSHTSAGVRGRSQTGRGGVFESGDADNLVGQVRLVPQPMAVPTVVRAAPIMFDPAQLTSLPRTGQGGDLLVTQDPDGRCTLWFCVRGPDAERPADWREVLLGRPAMRGLTQVAWSHNVVDVVGVGSQDPRTVLGGPDGATLTLSPGASAATFGAFQPVAVRDLSELFTAATVTHGDLPGPADLAQVDVIAFERNGGGPSAGGGWESCNWTFGDGIGSVTVVWDGRPGIPRNPHVIANGSITGATYTGHFGITPPSPDLTIPAGEVISFLLFALPEISTDSPGFTVRVSGTPAPGPGQEATPDIDTIGVIHRG
jgi:hypothetical protein